jgi:hypothetical protein
MPTDRPSDGRPDKDDNGRHDKPNSDSRGSPKPDINSESGDSRSDNKPHLNNSSGHENHPEGAASLTICPAQFLFQLSEPSTSFPLCIPKTRPSAEQRGALRWDATPEEKATIVEAAMKATEGNLCLFPDEVSEYGTDYESYHVASI